MDELTILITWQPKSQCEVWINYDSNNKATIYSNSFTADASDGEQTGIFFSRRIMSAYRAYIHHVCTTSEIGIDSNAVDWLTMLSL